MGKKEKLFSAPRWTEPIGLKSDGSPSAISSGTKHYETEEERQKDIETTRYIREMLK
ncbi:hypothetical protein QQ991_07340 [Weizmannia coagulans]|nr:MULTISPECIES: hypothetical protein [Heyndrickxia]MBT2195792.1 hypothetical protein [Heyndrickxia coagulans]MBT2237997.1 hypothetical protein [Heyndrickxia coagulans]MCR4446077.1 hypothetical protein [Heyndrickxia coagulans]MCU6438810.1 hypothetical protein [Heyndrickxia coagulans]MCW8782303.1 hypothetical protein [Heyndrickxia coagulans]